MSEHGPWPQPTPEPQHEPPYQPQYQQPYQQQPSQPPRRPRRTLAAVTATALVAGVGGVGVGYAAAHLEWRSSPQASTNASGQVTTPGTTNGGSGSSGGSDGGSSGDGFGQWYDALPQLGQGQLQLPNIPDLPYTGGGGTQGESQSSGTPAKGAALTGLVRIVSTLKYENGKAAGTGLVLTSDGEVVTNHHVVAGATSVKVKVMTTGKTYTARVVGTDATDDVAVLQLDGASGLQTVETDTSGVSVGDPVTAVGDGNGNSYLSTVSGKVLAKNQHITTRSEGAARGEKLTGLIEISNDVVSGYSGGATYDSDGEVVGMTTAASSGTSDIVGYAVPIAKVLSVADDLEAGVHGSRYDYGYPAFLGVGLKSGTTVGGVYDGTPAAKAGIVAGDRITRVGSTSVSTTAGLRAQVASYSPGDSVTITWTSADGSSHTATVTMIKGPVR
jgi:S1-C subfamily serine protease